MTTISREFKTVTDIRGIANPHIVLDDWLMVSKDMIKPDTADVVLKKGDIITDYLVDDGKNLLTRFKIWEWNANKFKDIPEKKKQLFEEVL